MAKNKLNIFLDLMQIMDNAFVFKLKKKNPELSEQEIKHEIEKWYLDRPSAKNGDADGVPGDINRFK